MLGSDSCLHTHPYLAWEPSAKSCKAVALKPAESTLSSFHITVIYWKYPETCPWCFFGGNDPRLNSTMRKAWLMLRSWATGDGTPAVCCRISSRRSDAAGPVQSGGATRSSSMGPENSHGAVLFRHPFSGLLLFCLGFLGGGCLACPVKANIQQNVPLASQENQPAGPGLGRGHARETLARPVGGRTPNSRNGKALTRSAGARLGRSADAINPLRSSVFNFRRFGTLECELWWHSKFV